MLLLAQQRDLSCHLAPLDVVVYRCRILALVLDAPPQVRHLAVNALQGVRTRLLALGVRLAHARHFLFDESWIAQHRDERRPHGGVELVGFDAVHGRAADAGGVGAGGVAALVARPQAGAAATPRRRPGGQRVLAVGAEGVPAQERRLRIVVMLIAGAKHLLLAQPRMDGAGQLRRDERRGSGGRERDLLFGWAAHLATLLLVLVAHRLWDLLTLPAEGRRLPPKRPDAPQP